MFCTHPPKDRAEKTSVCVFYVSFGYFSLAAVHATVLTRPCYGCRLISMPTETEWATPYLIIAFTTHLVFLITDEWLIKSKVDV